MSETRKHRDKFLKYIKGNGVDLGYGGDPICETAISIDQENRYANVGGKPQHLAGDASHLYWFKDNVLDYVYSSHLIEDFENTEEALAEWIRVLKPGGHLCLLFPDEKVYRSIEVPGFWNRNHRYLDMGLGFIADMLRKISNIEIIEARELFDSDDYNCMIIARKIGD